MLKSNGRRNDPVGSTLLSGALPHNDLLTVPSNGARFLLLFI